MRQPRYALAALLLATACSSGAANSPETPDAAPDAQSGAQDAASGALPAWPAQWAADIQWSDFAADGTKTNTWTGHVAYDWALRAMRTDVLPPSPNAPAGPPIGEAGAMLMRDGFLYFLPATGGCSVTAAFGAPRPDWLTASRAAPAPTNTAGTRLSVDLAPFDAGLAGCFNYVFASSNENPLRFGGSPSCQDWPKGSYIEYANFVVGPQLDSRFEVPAGCAGDAGANSAGSDGCHLCHDAPR